MQSRTARFATTFVLACMSASIWLYPTAEAIDHKAAFWEQWWSKAPILEVNQLDSATVFALPLPMAARRAWWYRLSHRWSINTFEALSGLPQMDTLWCALGHQEQKFSYAAAPALHKSPETMVSRSSAGHSPKPSFQANETQSKPARPRIEAIDIQSADSLQWLSIPGIGPWTAHAILRERRKWGTLAGKAHLKKLYGMQERWQPAWDTLLLESPPHFQWNLNTSTMKELYECPAFNYKQVQRIVFYRENFGPVYWQQLAHWPEFAEADTTFLKLLVSN